LSQWWTPPLRLQVSACRTFLMMCDVPSMAVFCTESIECCPGIVSRYFCKLLLTIPVAPMITGMTKHFMFHILWIIIIIIIISKWYWPAVSSLMYVVGHLSLHAHISSTTIPSANY
jgi:hypothetical protein